VTSTAGHAFRRPLTAEDMSGLLGVYDTVRLDGGSVVEATQYATYAMLVSPHFTYRTELGDDPVTAGPLTPLELASALSYFLSNGPPDQELFDAAQSGVLDTPEGIRGQTLRMLALPEVRQNLEQAMFAYFQLGTLESVVIDPALVPAFDEGLRNSMYREAEVFIRDAMWDRVANLLTSRETVVNERLAAVYGIPFPPSDVMPDADGFASVTLPENRAGLLTLPGFLTSRSRPDQPSVVGRGLAVNAAFLCAENPPFPEALAPEIDAVAEELSALTEREKSEYRMSTPQCMGCHIGFDPYGLALDRYDIIGQYREVDGEGRMIDASVTLPPNAGGATVEGAPQMAAVLAQTDAFATCVVKNFLAYALAEGGASTRSCATQSIAGRFATSDGSFASLIAEVAVAEAFVQRASGEGE